MWLEFPSAFKFTFKNHWDVGDSLKLFEESGDTKSPAMISMMGASLPAISYYREWCELVCSMSCSDISVVWSCVIMLAHRGYVILFDYDAAGNTGLLLLTGKRIDKLIFQFYWHCCDIDRAPFIWVCISFKFLLGSLCLGLSVRKNRIFPPFTPSFLNRCGF